MDTKKDVVIYTRFSSHNQNEHSTERQIQYCKEYAERNNYNIVHIYTDEAQSGMSDNRQQFKQMIKDSEDKLFQGVLVYSQDRFARNRYDSVMYKDKLKKNGVRVFSVCENITDAPCGVVVESLFEGMAEFYSLELGQKASRGMAMNASKFFYNGGIVPLGLKLKSVPVPLGANGKTIYKKQYDIDNEKAPIVREIFKMYTTDYTIVDIIKYLNQRNIKTSQGKEFNKNSVRLILTNKKYIGIYAYKGNETPDIIPRIIDNDTFYKAQEKLSKNKHAPARAKAKVEYLLTPKLFCGTCKEMMVGVSGTSGNGKLHCYYGCKGNLKKKCKKKNVHKDYIEDLVINKAKELLTDENIKKIANAVYKTTYETQDNQRIKQLQRDFIDIEKQKANLFDSLKICEIDSVKKSIFEEISKIEQQKLDIENEIKFEKSHTFQITEKDIIKFLIGLRNGDYSNIKYRKMIISVLINKVYFYDKNIIIIFNIQDNNGDLVKANIPSITEIEKSLTQTNCSYKGILAGLARFELAHA